MINIKDRLKTYSIACDTTGEHMLAMCLRETIAHIEELEQKLSRAEVTVSHYSWEAEARREAIERERLAGWEHMGG